MSNITRHVEKIRSDSTWAWLYMMLKRFLGNLADRWLDLAELLIEGIETSDGLSGEEKRKIVSTSLKWAALKWGKKVPSVVVNLVIEVIVALWRIYDDKQIGDPAQDDKEDDSPSAPDTDSGPGPEPEDPSAGEADPVDPGTDVAGDEEGGSDEDADEPETGSDGTGGDGAPYRWRHLLPIPSDNELREKGFVDGDVILQNGGQYIVERGDQYGPGTWVGWEFIRRISV